MRDAIEVMPAYKEAAEALGRSLNAIMVKWNRIKPRKQTALKVKPNASKINHEHIDDGTKKKSSSFSYVVIDKDQMLRAKSITVDFEMKNIIYNY